MWSEIKKENWKNVPCTRVNQATEEDVKLGCAVFYVKPNTEGGEGIYEIALPHLAIWHDSENGKNIFGVVIQAEKSDGNVIIGFRPFEGGNLLATLEEFTFINSLDELEQIDRTFI